MKRGQPRGNRVHCTPAIKSEPGGWPNAVYHRTGETVLEMGRRCTCRGDLERSRADGGRYAAGKSGRMGSLPTFRDGVGGTEKKATAPDQAIRVCLAAGMELVASELDDSKPR